MSFTNKQREAVINGIWEGAITLRNLPIEIYTGTAKVLKKSVKEGLALSKGKLFEALNDNMDMFSAAKTFQQTLAMESLITKGMELSEFQDLATKTFDLYNSTYLDAESNSALLQSQNARDWANIEDSKDVLPMLRYSAVVDENTAEVCLQCDGVTLPVDDPFWDTYSPENHYNCRCLLEQLGEDHNEVQPIESIVKPDPVFDNNVGKTGEVFTRDHPYFDVQKEYKEFAKQNFGLPI